MTVDQILIAMRQAGTNSYSWSLPRREAEVLVAEVDRLRGEAERERAAVVVWLREVADAPETYIDEGIALRDASAAIERGEHRREEKP